VKKITTWTLTAGCISLAIIATFNSFSDSSNLPHNKLSLTLALPLPNPSIVNRQEKDSEDRWQTHVVKPGENLSIIFSKIGIDKRSLSAIINSSESAQELANLYPGKKIDYQLDALGKLKNLAYFPNKIDTISVSRDDDSYHVNKTSKTIDKRIAHAHALITSSLFADAKAAGLTDRAVMEVVKIFAWDIDFALDLRPGDEFTVIYEQSYVNGEVVGSGNIMAVEFINRGISHTALRYTDSAGDSAYYTRDGKSLRKAFIRTPVEFARISSHFNLRRRHPVLNRIRAHKGVDYAAPTGTPVHATGNGKIVFRGRKGGYGRVVIIQHGKSYSTLYAHLSKFNNKARKNTSVTQGQTIGYVGKSGLATGPHLHYEFRIDGKHRNPLTVKLPKILSVNPEMLADFKTTTAPLISQLELYRTELFAKID